MPPRQLHLLVVPNEHYDDIKQLSRSHVPLLRHMQATALRLAAARGHSSPEQLQVGFTRPPFNSVAHVHMHCVAKPLTARALRRAFLEHRWLFVAADELIAELER